MREAQAPSLRRFADADIGLPLHAAIDLISRQTLIGPNDVISMKSYAAPRMISDSWMAA